MGWYSKEQPTPFDHQAIPGLYFLDGDALATRLDQRWTVGQKFPTVVFPSGEMCDLWETGRPEVVGIIHIFGEMDLPFKDNRDSAYEQAYSIAEQCGYMVSKMGENALEVWGHDTGEHFKILYDPTTGQMMDIQPMSPRTSEVVFPTMELLTEEIRQQLPKLYSGEKLGLDAPALVKFFSADSGWHWYASEFDGEDIFFGLVAGLEVELGYFALSELQEIRGPLGLPIERDLDYTPKTLRELEELHRRKRGE